MSIDKKGRGRPKAKRQVGFDLRAEYFKPVGCFTSEFHSVTIRLEELEAMRLVDLQGFEQEEAAKAMGVSRKTVWRELQTARKKLVDALVNGKGIRIEGGHYEKSKQSFLALNA